MLPIDTGSKDEIDRKLSSFLAQQGRQVPQAVLVISYETLRLHAEVMHSRSIGMVICDEVTSECTNRVFDNTSNVCRVTG